MDTRLKTEARLFKGARSLSAYTPVGLQKYSSFVFITSC